MQFDPTKIPAFVQALLALIVRDLQDPVIQGIVADVGAVVAAPDPATKTAAIVKTVVDVVKRAAADANDQAIQSLIAQAEAIITG